MWIAEMGGVRIGGTPLDDGVVEGLEEGDGGTGYGAVERRWAFMAVRREAGRGEGGEVEEGSWTRGGAGAGAVIGGVSICRSRRAGVAVRYEG